MEIRVEERLTGREWLTRLQKRYGSAEALKAQAETGGSEAWADWMDYQLLTSDPRRLDDDYRLTSIAVISARELRLLTPERMRLLARLSSAKKPLNVTAIAKRLGRNKKNVSEDLRILEELGLVAMVRHGREAIPEPRGNSIHIVLSEAAEA